MSDMATYTLLRDSAATLDEMTRALDALVRARGAFDTSGELARLVAAGRRHADAVAAEAPRHRPSAALLRWSEGNAAAMEYLKPRPRVNGNGKH